MLLVVTGCCSRLCQKNSGDNIFCISSNTWGVHRYVPQRAFAHVVTWYIVCTSQVAVRKHAVISTYWLSDYHITEALEKLFIPPSVIFLRSDQHGTGWKLPAYSRSAVIVVLYMLQLPSEVWCDVNANKITIMSDGVNQDKLDFFPLLLLLLVLCSLLVYSQPLP